MQVDGERLSKVEANVEHLSSDVGDMKAELTVMKDINKNIEISVAKLTLIAEQDQRRDEQILPRIVALENWRWKIVGMATVAAAVATIAISTYGAEIKALISS